MPIPGVAHLDYDCLIGSLFVATYAYHRFTSDEPEKSRSLRFRAATCLYILLNLITYLILLSFPEILNLFADYYEFTLPKFLSEFSRPYFVALLLTVLLPAIPWYPVDRKLRQKFREITNVPGAVRDLCKAMLSARYAAPKPLRGCLRSEIRRKGLDETQIMAEIKAGSTSLEDIWTKIMALMCRLENIILEGGRLFHYLQTSAESYPRLRCRYEALSQSMNHCRRLHHCLGNFSGDDEYRRAILACTETFEEQSKTLLQSICQYISRGIVEYCPTAALRAAELQSFGFIDIHLPRASITIHQFSSLFLALAFIFLSGLTLLSRTRGSMVKPLMIASIYTVAVFWAIFPKNKWKICSRTPSSRPVAGYVLVSLLAAGTGLLISFFLNVIVLRDLGKAYTTLARNYPWAVMTFVTAFSTSFCLDNNPKAPPWPLRVLPKYQGTWLRWWEGGALAMILMATALLVRQLLTVVNPVYAVTAPPLKNVLFLVGVTGLIVGATIPHWYRMAAEPGVASASFTDEPAAGNAAAKD